MNTRSQSSQLAKPLWTDHGIKSGISVRELISTKKNKNKKHEKRSGGEWIVEHFPKIFARKEKANNNNNLPISVFAENI